jgi:hypothetical protein
MNTENGRKLDVITRVLAHCEAHPDESAAFRSYVEQLKEGAKRAEALATQQLGGTLNVRAATARKKELRDRLHHHFLVPLARVARRAATEEPGLGAIFKLPRTAGKHSNWRIAARRMVTEAEARKDLLTKYGLDDTLLPDLSAGLDQFSAAIERGANGRNASVGATADLDAVMDANMEIIDVLDGMNIHRLRDDPEQLAAWQSARNVVGPALTPKPATPPAGNTAQSAA